MFVLAKLQDVVRIPPWLFDKSLNEAIAEELNRKLANRVLYSVGLCIALHDVLSLEESFILPGDGASHTKTVFRYTVFRPYVDEVLTGRIKSCSNDGVQVSLGFFDDIVIPPTSLQQPARFDEAEQVWVWEYDNGKHSLFMDPGEEVRFRVAAETFTDTTPAGPELTTADPAAPAADPAQTQQRKTPYVITATINEPGLGLLSWWSNLG
ncbi:DNA-directed RNA polymerase III subunit RPC8-like [Pollicipes pollicipes]|nr:DNA-directed RNA polymerase III subunit RPC8-like isoform X2 [Pollicipes pollicipes]XP_037076660.1 DNA-directed RNA polymerase III subunit RPC8-like isoform X2 [Pollicipes pollicipes]XP_037076661.1 DNA-directed RNA polymerase III subunit RPC8-like isoform X2 [Pollicipes pollicipes]XP_037076665.1 DNA-directed RNA polymerase III subunit RPC8-like [Pollicipes pollicipes]